MAQEPYKGDVLQKIAGIAFIAGAVLTGVFNALFPRADDPSDVPEVLAKLADDETFTKIAFLGLAVGIWALTMGIAGVYRGISSGGAAAWARLGFYGVLVGATLFSVTAAIGIAATGAAADWVASGSGVTTSTYSTAAALNAAAQSVEFMFIVVFWLALVFLSIGIVLSSVYPKWLGWALLVLGVVTVAVAGVPLLLGGPDETLELVFAALAGVSTLWTLVLGIWITRREIQAM